MPIVTKCWDEKPAVRPTFEKLIPLLQQARIDYHLPRTICADAARLWSKVRAPLHICAPALMCRVVLEGQMACAV